MSPPRCVQLLRVTSASSEGPSGERRGPKQNTKERASYVSKNILCSCWGERARAARRIDGPDEQQTTDRRTRQTQADRHCVCVCVGARICAMIHFPVIPGHMAHMAL